MSVQLADVREAYAMLSGVVTRTPLEESRWLAGLVGGPVWLKAENLQRTGSFKIRGAYARMARLSAAEREAGVVAASAGNHAQGVALAAQLLGIRACVFMPEGAPIPKEKATRGYGAEVVFAGRYVDDALVAAREYAERTGAVLIHPFDHPDVVAGQGTCGLEILEQLPGAATVLVPTGGGGLVAGIGIAIKAERPDVRVVGVQAEGAAAFPASLRAGSPRALETMTTMADGIAVGCPGAVPFAAVTEHVDEVLTVSEESISRALVGLLERAKMVVEPAGAAGVAALLEHPGAVSTPAVAVLSGGNIDPLLMGRMIRHGMAAAGRYLFLRVTVTDSPGGLAELLAELAAAGANVLDVAHERTSPSLHVDEVLVRIQLETRGPTHAEALLARLREQGRRVELG
ncbi:threonine ammonia-lyase [Nocardioides zeae]|uniref:L-threonine dehydratase catabolic TdcB n=1 Tax=Nocardioides imazamoxiresistens TaxID=3231893 RepID=A0ABU3PYN5_9ACTN|nr:threonine ammonia-lyase [Nocardioides zeae]MDT9594356.1 threonine ammonia-lyase [Nocardioides zeae]